MPFHHDLCAFADYVTLLCDAVKALQKVRSPKRLTSILESLTLELGFRHFAIIEHCDLRPVLPCIVCLQNYPSIWAESFIDRRLYLHDPVLRACLTTGIGFEWSEIPRMIRLTAIQRKILADARRVGLGGGFSVPYNVPGERRGSCSFAVRCRRDLPLASLLPTSMIAGFAFHAARKVLRSEPNPAPIELTDRQIECVILAGYGKSDSVIGQLLGLTKNTVTNYLTAARQRFGVATRQQLLIAALFEGVIGFPDVITRQ